MFDYLNALYLAKITGAIFVYQEKQVSALSISFLHFPFSI